jgi:hypothetical protein
MTIVAVKQPAKAGFLCMAQRIKYFGLCTLEIGIERLHSYRIASIDTIAILIEQYQAVCA